MSYAYPVPARDRAASALLTAACTALVGWALLAGLAATRRPASAGEVSLFTTAPVARPPDRPPVPARARVKRRSGRASPRNIRSQATQVTAPVPVVPLPVPPPVTVAPVTGTGAVPTQGAAPVRGADYGAGGIGDGRGAGGDGDGDGGGWADETPPRRVRGRLRDSDYPDDAAETGASGLVSVRYHVEVDGRVTGCRVTRSSGSAALDAVTCRLIEKRFRYDPSRDARGRPVRSVVVVDHEWVMERDPAG